MESDFLKRKWRPETGDSEDQLDQPPSAWRVFATQTWTLASPELSEVNLGLTLGGPRVFTARAKY